MTQVQTATGQNAQGVLNSLPVGRSVSLDQAAQLLNVSRRTIYNRIREGKLQTIRTIGGSQRVLVMSLDENHRPSYAVVAAAGASAQENS